MEDKDKIAFDYQKGFNEGYLLALYEPELAKQIANAKGKGMRLEGMQHGQEQYLFEQSRDKLPSWLTGDRINKNNADLEKGLDIEPSLND